MNISKKYMAKSQVVDSTSKTFTVQTIDSRVLIQKEPWRLAESRRILGSINTSEWLTQCCSIVKKYDWMNLSNAISASTGDNQCDMAYCVRSEATNIPIMPCRDESAKEHLRSDGTYVLAGQGGLAVHIARVLEANGVKSIAFLSRSGTTSEASKTTVAFLQHRGVTVRVFKVDICDKGALSDVVADIRASMPPIRGLFQCAATLRDAIFDTMSYEYWQAAINPKTIGSWNLFESFPQNMDFFIFLSSSVGIIGNRGQANYATGNAFQDALARHINFKGGMRAVSIDLGPVLGAGMLADDPGTLDKLKATGFFGVRLKDFVCVVERAIAGFTKGRESIPPQVVMGVGTGGLMRQNKPADPYWTRTALFAHLNKVDMPENQDHLDSDTDVSKQTTKTLLSSAKTVDEACRIVNIGLCTVLAVSMGKQAEDIDEGRPPTAYGVDSLVAVNVRNWVYRECGVDLSIFEILSDTSITELSETISERGKFGTAK